MGGVNYLLYAKQRQLAKAGNSKNFANFVNIVRPNYKMTMNTPTLYIIAGCNGAGKTTASMTVLPEVLDCHEFVNADEMAKGLSPFRPEEVAIDAGRLMLKRIDYLLSKKETFAIETTLATKSYKNLVDRAKKIGYTTILLFFWLPSPEMAEQRVAARVISGGHNIPLETIHRRYWLGLKNLFSIFVPIVDFWSLYDNSDNAVCIVKNNLAIDENKLKEIKKTCQNKIE